MEPSALPGAPEGGGAGVIPVADGMPPDSGASAGAKVGATPGAMVTAGTPVVACAQPGEDIATKAKNNTTIAIGDDSLMAPARGPMGGFFRVLLCC